jgi:diketogulonate reductase-like aldo/keto reductase
VSLRFLLEKGVSPLPSARTPEYQKEDLDLHGFKLTADEVQALDRVVAPCRGDPALGLQKCWADPGDNMCMNSTGHTFHCP